MPLRTCSCHPTTDPTEGYVRLCGVGSVSPSSSWGIHVNRCCQSSTVTTFQGFVFRQVTSDMKILIPIWNKAMSRKNTPFCVLPHYQQTWTFIVINIIITTIIGGMFPHSGSGVAPQHGRGIPHGLFRRPSFNNDSIGAPNVIRIPVMVYYR